MNTRKFKSTHYFMFFISACVLGTSFASAQGVIVNEDEKINAPDETRFNLFGEAVAIDGNTAVISANKDSPTPLKGPPSPKRVPSTFLYGTVKIGYLSKN